VVFDYSVFLLQVAHELSAEQLLDMAIAMDRTGCCHNGLLRAIVVGADATADPQLRGDSVSSVGGNGGSGGTEEVRRESVLRVLKYDPTQLLELSRAIARLQV
jgi:hypothetical protein